MFRIARLSICFAKKTRIPSVGRIRQNIFSNRDRTYRSDIKPFTPRSCECPDLDDEFVVHEENEPDMESEKTFYNRCFIAKPLAEIITSYGEEINWDEVIKKSLELPSAVRLNKEIVKGFIAQLCEHERMFDALYSYLRYLVDNKELCTGMLYLICSAINKNKADLEKCIDIIYEIEETLQTEQNLPMYLCASVLMTSNKYKKIIDDNTNMMSHKSIEMQISSCFKNNDIDTAFSYINLWPANLIASFIPNYLKHIKKCAEEGQVPVSRVVTILDFLTANKMNPLANLTLNLMKELVCTLNSIDKEYRWVFEMTNVGDVCQICSGKLEKINISDEEVRILKKSIEKKVIFGKNINIRSTTREWISFLEYLKKKPYDIVIDGLNVMFAYVKDPQSFSNLLKYLDKLELTPLILGRKHFGSTSEYHMVQKKYPVFLTQDLSDDDVFVLYAALNKGKNCYFLTNDQMGFAKTDMDSPELEDIYIRWQALHQCFALKDRMILPHGLSLGWQKSASEKEDEFRYHLVMKDSSYRKVYCMSRVMKQTKK